MSLIKLCNALTKNWHKLSSAEKMLARKAGMLRPKRTYAIGLIKGNENIRKKLEHNINNKIKNFPCCFR